MPHLCSLCSPSPSLLYLVLCYSPPLYLSFSSFLSSISVPLSVEVVGDHSATSATPSPARSCQCTHRGALAGDFALDWQVLRVVKPSGVMACISNPCHQEVEGSVAKPRDPILSLYRGHGTFCKHRTTAPIQPFRVSVLSSDHTPPPGYHIHFPFLSHTHLSPLLFCGSQSNYYTELAISI